MQNERQDRHCRAAKKGIAKSKTTGELVSKSHALGMKDLICPECGLDFVLRNAGLKNASFAHKAYWTPIITRNESKLHLHCKQNFFDYLSQLYPDGNWDMERTIKLNEKDKRSKVIPDVSGRIGKAGIILEVQASITDVATVKRRSEAYRNLGGYILWIIPLREAIDFKRFYSPRKFERYLHNMYYGRVYYWLPELGTKLLPIHFQDVYRHKELKTWVEDGEEKSGGGYDKRYKTLRDLLPAEPIDIATKFTPDKLSPFEHVIDPMMSVPERNVFKDNLTAWWKKGDYTIRD